MRKALATFVVLILTSAVAWGDKLTLSTGLSYGKVNIAGFDGGKVVFVITGSGNRVSKQVSKIKTLQIDGHDSLNKAEELVGQGKAAEAVKLYDAAVGAGGAEWLEQLIRHRRLQALEQARMTGRATEEWVVIVEESKFSQESLALRPKFFAKQGSKENGRAIAILKARLEKLSPGAGEDYELALKQLLLELYQHEGRDKEATGLAKELAAGTAPDDKGPEKANGDVRAQLKATAYLLEQGEAESALEKINANLERYEHHDLPMALLIAGKAQMALAGKARQREELLLKAGLNFMRVATFFSEAPEAPEALYLAGRINAMFARPNRQAAGAAYEAVIVRYGQSSFAEKARAELERLRSGP